MSYRIDYDSAHSGKGRHSAVPVMTAGFFLLFLALVFAFWTEGALLLREVFLPGDAAATAAALEAFSNELQGGASFADSLELFCQRVLDHAHTDLR